MAEKPRPERMEICKKCMSERRLIIIKDHRYYREIADNQEETIRRNLPSYWIRKIFSNICAHEWEVIDDRANYKPKI